MIGHGGWATPLVALAALCCTGCGDSDSAAQTTLDRLQADGIARVGYANEAPYAYRDTESGRLTGEAPEIARIVLERMGIPTVEGVLTEFGSLIPGLQAGRYDFIAAGMYVRPERCAEVAFSNPTYSVGEALVVQAGNPHGLHAYEDFREQGTATIGVVSGTVERSYARAVGIPDERIMTFPDAASALAGVRAGRVSAYAGTELTVQDLLSKDSAGLEQALPFRDLVIDGESVRGYGAFAFRKDDGEFLAAFNDELRTLIGSDAHMSLIARFGFTRSQLPESMTADELCALS